MPPELEQQSTQPSTMDQEPAAGDTVRQVAAEVLETMFFTEAELAACEHAWLETALCGRIQFEGSHSGDMQLAVSAEAADPIAASFLGLDPMELTDVERGQVIQELTNILCGAMLSHLWPESKLALASPELTVWQEWPDAGALHRCFMIPEGMLAISIRLISTSLADRPVAG
jgi:CheY-specific phosphatase CheX